MAAVIPCQTRPLKGHEIRERRRVGRRQISTAGRKLVDGVPFGRTFFGLRRARDRPQVETPRLAECRRFKNQGEGDGEDYYQEEAEEDG